MADRWIEVSDRMQQGYRYRLTAPIGGDLHADFHPDLTPEEMLALGVFGGKYMTDCKQEFPESWFRHARLSPGGRNEPNAEIDNAVGNGRTMQ